MKEQKLKKLMQLKAEKEEMIRILEKIERESSEPNVEASGSKIQKIINQKRMELEAIEAAIKELSK